ncbi:thiamine pyrophosphate-binding protein [Thermodesulfobacteriota bacterium]
MSEENEGAELGWREQYPHAASYIAETLKENGVEVAFGVHGGHIWCIVDELSYYGIKTVTVRHEQAGVYAAEAYAKATGKVGVAYATVGPGVANTVSAIQQAQISCSPVVLLMGGHEPEHDQTYTIQVSYGTKLMEGITKWSQRVIEPCNFKWFVSKAMNDSMAYPRGPIALEFTLSALTKDVPPNADPSMYGEHALYLENWNKAGVGKAYSMGADPEDVAKMVDSLYSAKNPVIFVGDGIHWSNGGKELTEFCELAQIPASGRRIGRGAMMETHSLFFSSRAAKGILKQSDLLFSLGMKIGFFDGYGGRWPETIQVNESPEQIYTFVNTKLAAIGNCRVVLKQMIDYVKEKGLEPPAERKEWTATVQGVQNKAREALLARADKYAKHAPVHPGWACKALWEVCEDMYEGMNRVIVDGFSISAFIPPFIQARYSGQVMDSSEQAGVGHGVGMSIGAAFGDPDSKDHPVLALMGDAGIGLGGWDIETAVRFKLPIVYLVHNNNGWLTSLKKMYGDKWAGLGEQDQPHGSESVPDIPYHEIYKLLGCHGELVENPEQFKPALERSFKAAEQGQPAVMNVMMDPTVGNPQLSTVTYQFCLYHIPWDKLPRIGKRMRLNAFRWIDWEDVGVDPADYPKVDMWEPVSLEDMIVE